MLGFLPKDFGLKSWGCFCNEIGIARFWSIPMAPPSILFVAFQVSKFFDPVNFPSSFKKLRKVRNVKGKWCLNKAFLKQVVLKIVMTSRTNPI